MAPTRKLTWTQRREGEDTGEKDVNEWMMMLQNGNIGEVLKRREDLMVEHGQLITERSSIMDSIAALNEEDTGKKRRPKLASSIEKKRKNLAARKCRLSKGIDAIVYQVAAIDAMVKSSKDKKKIRQLRSDNARLVSAYAQVTSALEQLRGNRKGNDQASEVLMSQGKVGIEADHDSPLTDDHPLYLFDEACTPSSCDALMGPVHFEGQDSDTEAGMPVTSEVIPEDTAQDIPDSFPGAFDVDSFLQ